MLQPPKRIPPNGLSFPPTASNFSMSSLGQLSAIGVCADGLLFSLSSDVDVLVIVCDV